MNSNSVNNGLHTIVPTIVSTSSMRSSATNTTIISNGSSPINVFANISSGNLSANSNSAANNQNQSSSSSRLKVEDALSYLDRVKNQFSLQPHVYNQFLDIMKEFKSQSIDTQQVINRVSTLFHGHPDLIFGFNTFLPPGYKIEVTDDHFGYIQVTHPTSGTESIAIGNLHSNPTYTYSITTPTTTIVRHSSNLLSQDQDETFGAGENFRSSTNSTAQAVNVLISAANTPQQPYFGTTGGVNLNSKTNKQSSSTANCSAPVTATPIGQPVEFNHAINYVNKIKNRFHQNPNVYKTFLEILYAYQKQQKTPKDLLSDSSSTIETEIEENFGTSILSETEVYTKVAQLFINHEDLLTEFSQFLPDASQKGTDRSKAISDLISFSSATSNIVRNNSTASYPTFTIIASGASKEDFSQQNQSNSTTIKSPLNDTMLAGSKRGISSSKSPIINKKKRTTNSLPFFNELNPQERQGLPSIDEVEFFDKVQKTLRSPTVFDNFLRCILLYTKQIVSRVELFGLVHNYLGHAPELLTKFQELINLREPGEIIIPQNIHDQTDADSMISIDYGACSQYGKSYRSIPRSFIPPVCSGRTQLCKDVLNDHCVLFPTFTDESSSVTTKKSIFEEHMFKIEDERFELDIVMEVNLSAIRALENVLAHINTLTSEQLNNFQLDDQLGGESSFTQRQAVQRIYGERASEIIDGLKKNPRVAVPIVLKRLKSKDEEWKESKKNFERFWKEQSEKYYLKSLDYMGINCKNSDARIIRNRHLLNEIESIKEEHDQQLTVNNHQPHLVFSYEDLSILDDAASLILFVMKRQMTFSKEDRQNMKKFILQVLPDFLFATRPELSDEDEDNDNDDNNEQNGKREKKARTTRQNDSNRKRPIEISTTKPRRWAQEYQNSNDMFHLFFVNDNYYYFFRLHQLLCERLTKISQQSTRLIEQENLEKKDYNNQRGRVSASSSAAARSTSRPTTNADEYYSAFLDLVRQMVEGTIDSSTYEDSLREMFGIHAYLAFTLDKIIQNCVRQLHAIIIDQSSESIMKLFTSSKGTEGLVEALYSVEQQNYEAIYQHEMEAYADGNRLFRLCSLKNDHRLTISLISIESSEADEEENEEEKEKIAENVTKYVESYLNSNQVDSDEILSAYVKSRLKKQPRFLVRTLLSPDGSKDKLSRNLMISNHDYCSIDGKTSKRTPIHRAGFSLYRRGSFRTTRQNHRQVTVKQYENFMKIQQKWSDQSLHNQEDEDTTNNLWNKTHRFTSNDQLRLVVEPYLSDCEKDLLCAPYRHYRQYRLIETDK